MHIKLCVMGKHSRVEMEKYILNNIATLTTENKEEYTLDSGR